MTEIDTLLPCPFCGSQRISLEKWTDGFDPHRSITWIASCADCSARTGSREEEQEDAVEAWNRRALSSRTSNEAVVRAARQVIAAEDAFRSVMQVGGDWEGDPLSDAVDALRSALVSGSAVPSDLASLIRPLEGYDHNQPGYQHRKGWNDALLYLMDLQRAGAAVPGEDGWKPINDEAKSGKRILAVENYQRSSWDDEGNETLHQEEANVVWWSGKHKGWVSYGLILESFEPTHWQPLPAPPLSQTVGEERT
jgi:Lar family restriction alleviation protein